MSSAESSYTLSSNESESEAVQPVHNSQPSAMSRGSTSSQRPLPDLPLPQPPTPTRSSHSGQTLSAILRDRPLPLVLPTPEQTSEAHRRSLVALDRKRRLTNTASYEETRRRANSGGWNRRQQPDFDNAHGQLPTSRSHASDPNLDRPLPEVIDLTGSSPPLESQISPRRRPSRQSSDPSRRYVVPRWQPDAEVPECPICKRPFTWMFRRHHCRKCGRVVCNDCSPHRITIPRQFIVQPPGPDVYTSPGCHLSRQESGEPSEDDLEVTAWGSHHHNTASHLDGGEKVRLCNPCVPDPQPVPPNYPPLLPSMPSRGPSWDAEPRPVPENSRSSILETRPRGFSAGMSHPARTSSMGNNPYLAQHSRALSANHPIYTHPDRRGDGLTIFGSYRGLSSPSRYRALPNPIIPHQQQSAGNFSRDNPPSDIRMPYHRPRLSYSDRRQPREEPSGTASSLPRFYPRPLHELTHSAAVQRPRLHENDICPICRRALPPRGAGGDETDREAHIMECINSRDASHHVEASNAAAAVRLAGSGSEAASSSQHPHSQRLNMLTYVATEKDCVAQDDGQTPECSICMVEYDVGDELVRLECLCKFHRSCMMEWVERKAECPVHKLIG